MTDVLVFLLVLVVCSLAATGSRLYRAVCRQRRSKADRLREDLLVADLRIDSEFQRARRAMNDAANQSWRNLAG